jgi:hypothetical protein
MFNSDIIETKVRNTKGLFAKLSNYPGGYEVQHSSPFGVKLMGEEHIEQLRMLAEAYSLNFDELGFTYTIKCYVKAGKDVIKVYQPRLILKKNTCQLQWGNVAKPLAELAKLAVGEDADLFITPQVVKGDKYTKYSIIIGTTYGDVPYPLYPREGCEPNSAQLSKSVKSGEGWSAIMERPYPTDLKTLVSQASQTFEFDLVGYSVSTKTGQKKDGGSFTVDELILESAEGDFYSTKNNNSINSKNIRYWGEQVSENNPVHVVISYSGQGDYQGKSYTQWDAVFTPLNQAEDTSLSDLLDLGDPMADAYGEVDDSNTLEDELSELV